jgi:hypothetical protein
MASGKRRTAIIFILVLVGLLSIAGVVFALSRTRYLHPSPETKSAFFKSYTPDRALDSFQCNGSHSKASSQAGSKAGHEFVTERKEFEPALVIKAKNWMPLMSRLAHDVASQLTTQGSTILDQTGDARDGFRFDYTVGNTFGTVTIRPMEIIDPRSVTGETGILPDEQAVRMHISIHEQWFKTKPGVITLEVTDHAEPAPLHDPR